MSRIILAVFDGLQPTQINKKLTPNLYQYSERACFFENNHAVFPTVTRINAATLVTGVYPGLHGLPANTFVDQESQGNVVISAMEPVLSSMAARNIPVLRSQSLQEILKLYDMEYVALGVGTSGNAYLHNSLAEEIGGATIHPDFTLPSHLYDRLNVKYGSWPEADIPNTRRYEKAMDMFLDYVLKERNPEVALIWSSEPDKSQHLFGVGDSMSNQALFEADKQFGRLLEHIENNQPEAHLFVLSDHGYSTIIESVDLESEILSAGFNKKNGQRDILIAPNGASALFYFTHLDSVIIDDFAQWIMEQPWCGSVLGSERIGDIDGTIPLKKVFLEGPRSPDIALSFRWDDSLNINGFSGQVYSASGSSGAGTHGSMSRYEINNLLMCSGPLFRESVRSLAPTGNIDLLPTILKVLGVPEPKGISGRVLVEGFDHQPPLICNTSYLRASRKVGNGIYNQEVKMSDISGTVYVDEGNGYLI